MSDKQRRVVFCAVMIALYAAGLVLMLLRQAEAGLFLWGVSTLGGMAFLWARRREAPREEAKGKDGSDDPCE